MPFSVNTPPFSVTLPKATLAVSLATQAPLVTITLYSPSLSTVRVDPVEPSLHSYLYVPLSVAATDGSSISPPAQALVSFNTSTGSWSTPIFSVSLFTVQVASSADVTCTQYSPDSFTHSVSRSAVSVPILVLPSYHWYR